LIVDIRLNNAQCSWFAVGCLFIEFSHRLAGFAGCDHIGVIGGSGAS